MDHAHPFRTGGFGERLRHLAEYLPLRAVAASLQCVSEDQNLRSAKHLAALYRLVSKARCERARLNIRRAFPTMNENEVNRIAAASIEYMVRLFCVDSLVMPRLVTPSTWMQHVELGDLRDDLSVLTAGKPCLLIGAHCGNWELLGFTLAVMGFPMTALARPLDNVYLNRWLLSLRERRGLRVLTKWGATDQINTLISGEDPAGRRIGFIADQNAGERGLFVPFLGKLASSYKSIGLLAMHHNVPIIAGYARRIGDSFRYRLEVVDRFGPEAWSDQPDPLFYITARFNRAIERMVEQSPEQYLWIHRRWKSRPQWEQEGKEMPASLRSRLEGLPWMTQEELDRVLNAETFA